MAAKPERCPICSSSVDGSRALPFCSERCRTVDLGNWLGESYRIPVEREDESEGESEQDADGESSSS